MYSLPFLSVCGSLLQSYNYSFDRVEEYFEKENISQAQDKKFQ